MNSLPGTSSTIAKSTESKMSHAYVKARNSNYQTTVEAIPHTIPMVSTQLATTVLSEILLTLQAEVSRCKALLYLSEDLLKVAILIIF